MIGMSKHRHPLLIIGLLMMIACVGAGQVSTVKPGEQVERNLPDDQPSRQWSHYPDDAEHGDRLEVRKVAAEKPVDRAAPRLGSWVGACGAARGCITCAERRC